MGRRKTERQELLPGTLDMLILKTLALEAMHGWGISQRIQQVSGGVLSINQGSLYPALYRLEAQGLLATEWGASDNNRRAKYYSLTAAGRKRLRDEEAEWKRVSGAITLALTARPTEV
jgi:PadR family transcriptional regulator, regulatory protein PadR